MTSHLHAIPPFCKNESHNLSHYHKLDTSLHGCEILIRAIRPSDKLALKNGFKRLSPRSVYCRFLGYRKELTEAELKDLTEVDFIHHVALVAEFHPANKPVGVGRFVVLPDAGLITAEAAITIDEEFHGLGIATLLLNHLLQIGKFLNIQQVVAEVLSSNREMLNIIHRMNLNTQKEISGDCVKITLHL
ncbi:GNAT family N-acetyltransferase [Fulvivirga sp. M361]|uniref:GNAT family N-acetyltransferase n=1 Tax=Fulvivirga sp. M361 TaxID=2594266 RepID=UPI001625F69D|nr:GNAT family N-acetyltransferase [Fulvivirga sp. M361]